MTLLEQKKEARKALRRVRDAGVTMRQIAESWTTHPKGLRKSEAEFEELCAETELRLKKFCDGTGELFGLEVGRLLRIEECLPELLSIRSSLLEFTRLGAIDKALSEHVQLDPARVSKLRGHTFLVDQSNEKLCETAQMLSAKLTEWKAKTLKLILQSASAQVEILDFCHEQGTSVDDKLRGAAIGALALELVSPAEADGAHAALPKGTRGFLARIGASMYVAFAGQDDKRAIAHELRHLAARLESEANQEEGASSAAQGPSSEQFQ